ncbi:unnamed protein product [Pleuronectes platessa]|uniref:Uncharacterized protein n=1 Tax=Pleuronectes platessa TaxID=8262 RepID=A0A9N7TM94_PLEPL|nr:unnamed protein product [Pleuronectes platessa]
MRASCAHVAFTTSWWETRGALGREVRIVPQPLSVDNLLNEFVPGADSRDAACGKEAQLTGDQATTSDSR